MSYKERSRIMSDSITIENKTFGEMKVAKCECAAGMMSACLDEAH